MAKPFKFDEALLEYATERQREVLQTVIECGHNGKAAAKKLGIHPGGPHSTLEAVKKRAAVRGYSPGHFDAGTAPGFKMGKVTVQRGPNGVERVWERQSPEQANAQEALATAARALSEDLPRLKPVRPPQEVMADLCGLYTLTDAHVGMLAWHREGGADWDLEIAENTIVGCFRQAIEQTPPSQQAIFNQLGDLLHYDSLTAVTPTSGHILDADSRFPKMVEAAVRIVRRVIEMLLERHASVHVIMAEGNHDMASSVWLRIMLKALYEEEPRITVDDSALPYYAHQWGDVMNGFHHAHLKRNLGDLRSHMAAQFPEMWGATKYRYCHTGDKHHAAEKDEYGMHMIQHPTLAARDAYAARFGWHSFRRMDAMLFHKANGLVGRVFVSPDMLEAT